MKTFYPNLYASGQLHLIIMTQGKDNSKGKIKYEDYRNEKCKEWFDERDEKGNKNERKILLAFSSHI